MEIIGLFINQHLLLLLMVGTLMLPTLGFIGGALAIREKYKMIMDDANEVFVKNETMLREDISHLQNDILAEQSMSSALTKKLALVSRDFQVTLDELNLQRSKLKSDDTYKNEVYAAIINFYQTTHSLLWRGSLDKFVQDLLSRNYLAQTSDETQRMVKNLYELKSRYTVFPTELRAILINTPQTLDQLTDSIFSGDEFVQATVIVPVENVDELYRYTNTLRNAHHEKQSQLSVEES